MIQERVVNIEGVSFWYSTVYKVPRFTSALFGFQKTKCRKKRALDNVTFPLRKNRITALLGQNGSGKTTLIKLISGARYLQAGSIEVFGTTPEKARHRVGLCLGSTLVYHRLTGRENLEYYGKLFQAHPLSQRIDELSERLGFTPYLDQLVETYSFGTKAKLALARALIHNPELLILDEPTLGIDYGLSQDIRSFIRNMSCTILLTTHYMEEAEFLAHDLCIIDEGRILIYGTKEEVLKTLGATTVASAYSKALLLAKDARESSIEKPTPRIPERLLTSVNA